MSNTSYSDSESENLSENEISTKVPQNFFQEKYLYYKKIVNPHISRVKSDILIKKSTDVKKCIAYCIELMFNKQYPYVKFSAVSQNMDKVVFMAELLKRKVKNLHQNNELSTFKYFEVYTPKKPSEDRYKFKVEKLSTCLSIQLFRSKPKDTKTYGYQQPIQISLVSSRDPREYIDHVVNYENLTKKKKQLKQMRDYQKNQKYQAKDSYSQQQHKKQMDYQKRHQKNKQGDHQQKHNQQFRGQQNQKYQKKNNNQHYNKNKQNNNNHHKNSQHHKEQDNNQKNVNKNYQQKQHYKQKNEIYQKKEPKQQKNENKQQKTHKQEKKNPEDYADYYYKKSGKKQKKRQEFEYVKKEEKPTENEYYVKKTD